MNYSESTKCIHCNTLLGPIDKQPCSNCGRMERKILMVVEDIINIGEMRDNDLTNFISGKTNRSIIYANSRNEPETDKLQTLINDYVQHDTSDLASYLDVLVKDFNNRLCLTGTVFYRALAKSEKGNLRSNQIGPSPNPCDGRYNSVGEKSFYLSDTIDFLYQELNSSSVLVQKFNIPVSTLKIADLSSINTSIHNSLASAFYMAESGRTFSGCHFEKILETRGKSKYLVSQLLSAYFKKYSWEGLYIPGVHGNPGHHYHNLVIFGSAVDKWENWADGQCFSKTKE